MTTIIALAGRVEVRRSVASMLSAPRQEMVRGEANRWIKSLRLVRYGDATMRQRFTYRGESLWWFTELYLHKMRRLEVAIATVFALEAALEEFGASGLAVETDDGAVAAAARAFADAHHTAIGVRITSGATSRSHVPGLLVGLSTLLSRLRPSSPLGGSQAKIAAFVHTAFWRGSDNNGQGRESYIGAVLEALGERVREDELARVGLGPRRTFRSRRWWDPLTGAGAGPRVTPIERFSPRPALAESTKVWHERNDLARKVTSGDAVRASGMFRQYDLWPVLRAELEQVARVQWPWSTRAMDEARSALAAIQPKVVLTYAEAGGWGRALVLEARQMGIPSVGLQHGFIYRHWLNYQHEPDEMLTDGVQRGFPLPDRTLVFDRYAAATLENAGHFPSDSLRVTGSSRLDELVARMRGLGSRRESLRGSLGLDDGTKLVVLAAKASEIDAHLPAIFAAVSSLPGVRMIVKPHPAETAQVYLRYATNAHSVTVEPPEADLGRLLAAADALITMNSTVAIDGLALGLPTLVVGIPCNLSPFVDAEVMDGSAGGDAVRPALERLLYNRDHRDALLSRAAAFADTYSMRSDGRSAARAAEEILALTD